MNRMAVSYHKYFVSFMFYQSSKKINEQFSCKFAAINSKRKIPTIGNAGNHVCPKSLTRAWNFGCLTFRRPTCSCLVVGSHSRFVFPMDFRLQLRCASLNRRIFFLKPILDILAVLLIRFSYRFLRCKTPSSQVSSNGPDRKVQTTSTSYQHLNRFSGPKNERQLHLFRTTISNNPYYTCGLMPFKLRNRRATLFTAQANHLDRLVDRNDAAHPLMGQIS